MSPYIMNNEADFSMPQDVAPVNSEKKLSSGLKELAQRMEASSTGEEKIGLCLAFMRGALADRVPRFKDYWEAKKICLPLFKEALPPHVRSVLWGEYIEISTEARHLKEILDEQSTFASEQIDLAIKSIEGDLEKYDELLASVTLAFPPLAEQAKNREQYAALQKELNLLNAFAGRATSLRKEVMKTEMRIRNKNKFFERLSLIGDRIFPKRKELIKQVSALFLADVTEFTGQQFTPEALQRGSIVDLRNDIKQFQQWAKQLTLDAHTFNHTRTALSQAWDSLKEYGQELQKEFAQKSERYQKNFELVMDKIKLLEERCKVETFTHDDAMKQSHDVLTFMKSVELGRDEVRALKEAIFKARSPVDEREREKHQAREKEIEEAQRQRLDKIEEFKQRIHTAIESIETKSADDLVKSREELQKQLNLLNITQAEKELLEQTLKEFRDKILEKKEKALASLSQEDRSSLEHLQHILDERKAQKNEIRAQLDLYRKALSTSGFDFEKAIRYRELMDAEKVRLEKVTTAIEEIESKIEELENS